MNSVEGSGALAPHDLSKSPIYKIKGAHMTCPTPKSKRTSNGIKIPVLISSARIQNKVRRLARQISKDYRHRTPLIICILNGAFVFMTDLLKNLTIPIEYDFIRLSSYGQTTKSSGRIKVVLPTRLGSDITSQVKGKDIIIVDDIIDTGLTARFLTNRFKQARSIRICALLNKKTHRIDQVKIDYLGFNITNKFVVGYGLDYNEQYRQLDYVGYIPD
ncbi:MAG TPA: hypoxanthine phosphoribosyltransferase [Planctomycetota bacterium]|nr:hypoxanthine phosphoribosyltransferase [Planctomycetota bacterium]